MSKKMLGGVLEIPCFQNGLPITIGSLILAIALILGFSLFPDFGSIQAQTPAPAPPPAVNGAFQTARYRINFENVSYFYFTKDGGAAVFFPGIPALVLNNVDAEVVRDYLQNSGPVAVWNRPLGLGEQGRYHVNMSHYAYAVASNSGETILHFLGNPPIALNESEARHFKFLPSEYGSKMGIPAGGDRIPVSVPVQRPAPPPPSATGTAPPPGYDEAGSTGAPGMVPR